MKHTTLRAIALLTAMTLIPATSFADDGNSGSSGDGGLSGFLSTSSTTSLIVGLPLTTTGVVVIITSMAGSQQRTPPRRQQRRAIQMYLKSNQEGVLEGQAMGAGSAVNDLAALFGVPAGHERAMGLAMRSERDKLDTLLMTPCSDDASCTALADQWIDVAFAALDRNLP
jgi:hypothetical protein